MKTIAAILLMLTASLVAQVAEPQASEASVRELLEVTQSRKLLDGMMEQMDAQMQASIQQAMGDKTPTAGQQAVFDEMREKSVAMMRDEMKWEVVEPGFIRIYRETFTDAEIAGMVAFYRSPAGEAVVKKMPIVMQQSMLMVQQLMSGFMPKLQQIQNDAVRKLSRTSEEAEVTGPDQTEQ